MVVRMSKKSGPCVIVVGRWKLSLCVSVSCRKTFMYEDGEYSGMLLLVLRLLGWPRCEYFTPPMW